MQSKEKLRRFTGGILALFAFALLSPISQPVSAMMIAHQENSDMPGKKITKTAKPKHKSISFIAWQGKRLITTAGVFLITDSVTLLDLAGSRYLEKGASGQVPSVHLTFKNRKLIKVIIR